LFGATHTHPASKCPMQTAEGKAMMKKLFSDENIKKSGVKMVSAHVSCPKDTSAEHKGFFIVEADRSATVTKFFGPMTVDVRPVVSFSEVAKTL